MGQSIILNQEGLRYIKQNLLDLWNITSWPDIRRANQNFAATFPVIGYKPKQRNRQKYKQLSEEKDEQSVSGINDLEVSAVLREFANNH